MAFATFGPVPFPPLQLLDTDSPVEQDRLLDLLAKRRQASVLVRSESGPVQRGGYFFHIRKNPGGIEFVDFSGTPVTTLTYDEATRLINHASGRRFDPEMLVKCQRIINLRQDD